VPNGLKPPGRRTGAVRFPVARLSGPCMNRPVCIYPPAVFPQFVSAEAAGFHHKGSRFTAGVVGIRGAQNLNADDVIVVAEEEASVYRHRSSPAHPHSTRPHTTPAARIVGGITLRHARQLTWPSHCTRRRQARKPKRGELSQPIGYFLPCSVPCAFAASSACSVA
jgi:hypothetical protein